MLDIKALNIALDNLEKEKKISREKIIEGVERSLAAAYQKEYGKKGQVIRCVINFDTGETTFEQIKTVVDETTIRMVDNEEEEIINEKDLEEGEVLLPKYNEEKHILFSTAKLLRKNVELGEEISFSLENKSDFGRIAAQTAKQVIIQKMREAENELLKDEFEGKDGSVVSGIVQRIERGVVYVDLGKVIAIMPQEEQIKNERLTQGQRIRAYLYSISDMGKGLSLRLSRSHPKFLSELFKIESTEIADGIVEIVSVAREAGERSKIAVKSNDNRVDPVGACIGHKGVRVNSIHNELNREKIDIIEWTENISKYISNSLSPAKVLDIELFEEEKRANVKVLMQEQSLAIGRGGQNVRLAAKLTGWKIDILGEEGIIIEANEEGVVDGESLLENNNAKIETIDEEIVEELDSFENKTIEGEIHEANNGKINEDY